MLRNLHQVIAGLFVLIVGASLSNHPSARADDPKKPPPDRPVPVFQDGDAIKELRRLGATVVAVKPSDGKSDAVSVKLAGDWHGTSNDLKLLSRVSNLERLSAFGVPITDDDLKLLDGLSRLNLVELFGTKVTADGAAVRQGASEYHDRSPHERHFGRGWRRHPGGCSDRERPVWFASRPWWLDAGRHCLEVRGPRCWRL